MRAAWVIKVESGVDRMAAALFAGACAFAAYQWFAVRAGQPLLAAETSAAGLFAYFVSLRGLSSVQPAPRRLPVPIFDVREVEPFVARAACADAEQAGPLATDEAEEAGPPATDDALLLDDILAEVAADARVVRLFDPAAMPTAGELQMRIDRHLDGSPAHTADASQALHDALAELRRSIG